MTEGERQNSEESWSEEIHRRGLWQAAAGYLAAGWALIEVVDILIGQDVLPASVFRGALIVLGLGFPVILGTAYVQSGGRRSGASRLLSWRNAFLGGIGAFALLGLFTAGSTLMRAAGGPEGEIEPDRIAVLPFSVSGSSELAYLGEGIVDLVSARLDGAGPLTAVDPRVVIAGTGEDGVDPRDPEAADRLAASFRAGRFVTGDLLEASGRVRLTAYLHETGRDDDARRTATVEGPADSVFTLLDGLVNRLVAEVVSDENEFQARAALTTGSIEAVKQYLNGERQLRAGEYRAAAESYQRAVELDSAFALAHYRRTIAADWIDGYDIRSSAERATAYADRLSPRERTVLEAVRLRRNGRVTEAEQKFRTRLHADPDDLEALVQYGELLFHDVARRGRSPREAMAPFRRALELEPANQIALIHLARLYALTDSTSRVGEIIAEARNPGPENEHAAEMEALRISRSADTAEISAGMTAVTGMLEGRPWYFRFYASHALMNYGRNPWLAARLLEGHRDDDPLLRLLGLKADLTLGRVAAAETFLARPTIRDDPRWSMVEALLYALEMLPADRARMAALEQRLASTTAEELLRGAWVPPYEDMTSRLMEYERDAIRAHLLIRLGRTDEARAILDALRAEAEFTGVGSVKRDAELGLEAELRLSAGNREGALEVLRRMELEVPHAITVRYLPDASRARFLRAQLEAELGDRETARAYYEGLDEAWSVWDSFYRPRIYERLGRLAEEAGDLDAAVAYYTRFIDLWADCDPELVPIREEVAARRNALLRALG